MTMEKLELKYKAHVVQNMILEHRKTNYGYDCYTLDSFNHDYDVFHLVFLVYWLFQLLTANKRIWAPYPHELSCINFVIKHLRFMLTNVQPDDLLDYARSNLFYQNKTA